MKTHNSNSNYTPYVDTDPEELVVVVDIPTMELRPIDDDPSDSTSGEHVFELLGASAAETGPLPEQPIDIEDAVTSRYLLKRESRA